MSVSHKLVFSMIPSFIYSLLNAIPMIKRGSKSTALDFVAYII